MFPEQVSFCLIRNIVRGLAGFLVLSRSNGRFPFFVLLYIPHFLWQHVRMEYIDVPWYYQCSES